MSSCLSADIRKVSTSLAADVSTANDALSVEVTNLRNFEASASLYGSRILAMVSEVGEHLRASCGISCNPYMVVSPDEPQWITCDEVIIYEVMSNVKWTVE